MEMRPIPGYEGLYSATSTGDIYSHKRKWRSGENRNNTREHNGIILRPYKDAYGYLNILLCNDGKITAWKLHRAVALAWNGMPEGFSRGNRMVQINHLNGDKQDNRPENLEWCSPKHNAIHRSKIIRNRRNKK